jgi:hypothetical protein
MGNALGARGLATAALLGAAVLAGGGVTTAAAQGRPLSVRPSQGLTFGVVIAGVPTAVSRTDALNAGQLEIRGSRGTQVRVDFTLPAAMTGPGGALMPLTFGANDGGWSQTPSIATALGFDPRVPLFATLSGNGRVYLYLGGTVTPAARQAPGAYTATITVTASYLN